MKFLRIPITNTEDETEIISFSSPHVEPVQQDTYLYVEDGTPLAFNLHLKRANDSQNNR